MRTYFEKNIHIEGRTVLEDRAAELGMSEEQVLAQDRQFVAELDFSSPECLSPHEAEMFFLNNLDEVRLSHIENCSMCTALLTVVQPSSEVIERVVGSVIARRKVAHRELASENELNLAANETRKSFILFGSIAAIALIAKVISLPISDEVLRNLVKADVFQVAPGIAIFFLLSFALVMFANKLPFIGGSPERLRLWGMSIGAALVAFVPLVATKDLGSDAVASRTAITWAQSALLESVANQAVPKTLQVGDSRGGIFISSLKDGQGLVASSAKFSGKVTVDTRSKPYSIYWTDSDASSRRILMGKVYQGVVQSGIETGTELVAGNAKFTITPTSYKGELKNGQQYFAVVEKGSDNVSMLAHSQTPTW